MSSCSYAFFITFFDIQDFVISLRYFRLKNPRKLKNLMIINKGGCDKDSPGIGDVAYVKNLLSDTIVTRNFRCSKFGLAHHPRTKFGWVCIFVLLLCIYSFTINEKRCVNKFRRILSKYIMLLLPKHVFVYHVFF